MNKQTGMSAPAELSQSGSGDMAMRSKSIFERIKDGKVINWQQSGLLDTMSHGDKVLLVEHFKKAEKVLLEDIDEDYNIIEQIAFPSIVRK